jgi:succinate dehydrogenase / fumarate reductase cytochrome b subunit
LALLGEFMANSNRPLSPHLQVYRPQWTMILSILHRITGVALGLGTLLLAWWLMAAATGPDAFATAQSIVGSIPGRFVLLGFTFSLFYHLTNGIRHLFWDVGVGFELKAAQKSGWFALALAVVLTVASWYVGYAMRGPI